MQNAGNESGSDSDRRSGDGATVQGSLDQPWAYTVRFWAAVAGKGWMMRYNEGMNNDQIKERLAVLRMHYGVNVAVLLAAGSATIKRAMEVVDPADDGLMWGGVILSGFALYNMVRGQAEIDERIGQIGG